MGIQGDGVAVLISEKYIFCVGQVVIHTNRMVNNSTYIYSVM